MKGAAMDAAVAEEVAHILLATKALGLAREPFMFVSGIWSPVYIDCRLLISHVGERDRLASLLVELARGADLIVGTATAGIPWATLVADRLKLPVAYVRGDKKAHGRRNQVEGIVETGQVARVVEDLVSTAGSCITTVTAIRDRGAQVTNVAAIITYDMQEAEENFREAQVTLDPLTAFRVLAAEAERVDYFSPRAMQAVSAWAEKPEVWGEKYGLRRGDSRVNEQVVFPWVVE
jgi:orotate phosphoribosyltransferase